MTEVKALRQRVNELEDQHTKDDETLVYIATLKQQLAASQAEKLRLREALIRSIERMCFAEPWSAAESDIKFAKEALSTPPGDQSALREVIAQVLAEVEHRRWATKLAIDQLRSGEWTPECLK